METLSGRRNAAPLLSRCAILAIIPLISWAALASKGTDRPIAPKPPSTPLLNLDLGNSAPHYGLAAAGDGPTDYWNYSYAPYQYYTEAFDLKWSTGDASNVSVTVENAPGLWSASHPDGMMDSFIHSFGGQPVVVTFRDLPNGTYDVYVYAHGEVDPQNSTITVQSGGTSYGPETTTSDSSWSSLTWAEGAQYVLLEEVSVVGGNTLVISASPAASPSYAFLNGIQLRQTSTHAKKAKVAKAPKPPKDALLNVDVANSVPWTGTAATGNGASDYWNVSFAPYQYFTELFDLKWSTGEASSVTASIENGPGTWGNGHPDPMMYGYIYTWGYDTITVTLSDLPNGTYDLYVYAHGGPPDDQNGVVSAEVNGVTYGPESTASDSSWLSPAWTEGAQYVLLQGVSVPAGSPLVIRSAPGVSGYAFLNGFQIRRTSQHAKRPKVEVAPPPPDNALMNLDLGSGTPWSGPAATSNSPSDYWNFSYAPYQYFAEVFDLKWSTGDPSNVSVTVENAPGLWNAGHPDGMMDTFIHSFYGLPVLLTFNDLPNGTYDVYVYAHGMIDPQNSTVSAAADGVTYGPETTTTDGSWLSPTWLEGSQYVLLEQVSVYAGSPLVIQVNPAAQPDYAFVNGIQLRHVSKHAKKPKQSVAPKPPKDALLNVDLGSSSPWHGVAATGDSETDYWNYSYAPYQYFAEVPNLSWSTGQPTDADLTIENAPGLWNAGHPDGMMDTFIHSFWGQPVQLTFNNLPNGTYDVYVYAHGMIDPQNSTVSATADGVSYGPETTTIDGSWLSPAWVEGSQYVLLEQVSVLAGSPLVIQVNPAAQPDYAFVNGIQLRQTSQHAKRPKPVVAAKPPKNPLMNMDLGSATPRAGTAAIGKSPSDYWNFSYAPYQYFAEAFDLKWSTGEPSNVSFSVENAPGLWNAGHPDGMMDTFIHSFYGLPVLLTFHDLPNGTYDVYVYAHGVLNEQNSSVRILADGITYGPETTTADSTWLSPIWTEGSQYVLLQNVSVVAGSPLVIQVDPLAMPDYAFVNGIQLLQTSSHAKAPKPAKVAKAPRNALLNIDVANDVPWTGTAATGNGPADVWNVSFAPYQYFAELFDLKWSTGEPSGVTATIENGPGTWGNGHPDPMMYGYIYTYGWDTITVTISGLPTGSYDAYVYAHGGPPDDQNSLVSAESRGIVYGPEATAVDTSWLSTDWLEGSQYVLLSGIAVSNGDALIIRSAPGQSGYAFLNGLQIHRTAAK